MIGLVAVSLRRRRFRTLLTATGIAVGVATIVALISVADGLQQSARGFLHLGRADLGLFQESVSDPTASLLPQSMVVRVRSQPGVADAAPIQLVVEAIRREPSAIVFGADRGSFPERRLVITAGRRSRRGEAMIGDALAMQLGLRPGDTLDVKQRGLRISGIYHSGVVFEDGGAVVSLGLAQALAGKPDSVTTIALSLDQGVTADQAIGRLERAFPGTVAISDPGQAVRADANSLLIGKAVVVIAVLALVIGGIAVTNTMVMAVLEREREFALLSAVGWSSGRVALLVLGEGVGVSLIGAALGLALGLAAGELLVRATGASAFVSPHVTAWGLGRALLVGVAIGILGGLYPAWRVTRLLPARVLARA